MGRLGTSKLLAMIGLCTLMLTITTAMPAYADGIGAANENDLFRATMCAAVAPGSPTCTSEPIPAGPDSETNPTPFNGMSTAIHLAIVADSPGNLTGRLVYDTNDEEGPAVWSWTCTWGTPGINIGTMTLSVVDPESDCSFESTGGGDITNDTPHWVEAELHAESGFVVVYSVFQTA